MKQEIPKITILFMPLLCLLAFIHAGEGIQCLECVWIQGLTESECKDPGSHPEKQKAYTVDCETRKRASDDNVEFCEVAWGCLDRGFGVRRPALHRACSIGPDANESSIIEPGPGNKTGQAICEEVETGECADKQSSVHNLFVCFCKGDLCNYSKHRSHKAAQETFLKRVCTFSATPPTSLVSAPQILFIPIVQMLSTIAQLTQK